MFTISLCYNQIKLLSCTYSKYRSYACIGDQIYCRDEYIEPKKALYLFNQDKLVLECTPEIEEALTSIKRTRDDPINKPIYEISRENELEEIASEHNLTSIRLAFQTVVFTDGKNLCLLTFLADNDESKL